MNMEIRLHSKAKEVLLNMGVEIQPNMRVAKDNDNLPFHSLYTTAMIKEFLPNVHVSLYENSLPAFQEWLRDDIEHETYNIVGMSISHFNVTDYAQKMMGDKSFLIASIGNSGKDTGYIETDKRFDLIGACDFNNRMRDYSSYGVTECDFCGFDGFNYMDEELFGTSYSRPLITLISACFTQLFFLQYKVYPTPLQLHHILARHSIDIDDIGFDIKSGYGIPVIPKDDNDIKFFPYMEIEENLIQSILPHKYGINVYFDRLIDKDKHSLNKLAYLIRRHLNFNNLTTVNYVGNIGSGTLDLMEDLIKNSSIAIDRMESGRF